jgi:hypothetical protein
MCNVWSNLEATFYLSQLVCLVWLRVSRARLVVAVAEDFG